MPYLPAPYNARRENVRKAKKFVTLQIMNLFILCISDELVVYKSLNFMVLTCTPNFLVV